MGFCSCFSSPQKLIKPATSAKVITLTDGSIQEYVTPTTVSSVLENSIGDHFLCSADELVYDSYIQAMQQEQVLSSGQIYFVLPNEMLNKLLTITAFAEMARLAVKANKIVDTNNNISNKKKIGSVLCPLLGAALAFVRKLFRKSLIPVIVNGLRDLMKTRSATEERILTKKMLRFNERFPGRKFLPSL